MKVILFLILGVISIFSQAQSVSYTIIGNTQNCSYIKDNTLAILCFEKNGLVPIDTAKINNSKFIFKGNTDTPQIASIYFFEAGFQKPYINKNIKIILENGESNIFFENEKYSITGTPNNIILNQLNNKIDSINMPYKTALSSFNKNSLDNDENILKMKEIRSIKKKCYKNIQDYYKEFIPNNISNYIGFMYFLTYYDLFSTEQQKKLLKEIPDIYKKDKEILNIHNSIIAAENTCIGKKFIEIEMCNPEGKNIKLSDIIARNKITMIDFWASWCGPCRAEMPSVVEAYKLYKHKGLEIVGISLDDNHNKWEKAIKDLGLKWLQISDLKGWKSKGAQLYNIKSIPSTILINQKGVIIAKDLRGKTLIDKLGELLK